MDIDATIQFWKDLTMPEINDETIVYHYTKADSLTNIIQANELWLTQIQFMNDVLEIDYAQDMVETAINNFEYEDKKLLINEFTKQREKINEKAYILSLSLNKDSLHLWNNYGEKDGYNIDFSFLELANWLKYSVSLNLGAESANRVHCYPGKVQYNKEMQIQILHFWLKKYMEELICLENAKDLKAKEIIYKYLEFLWKLLIMSSYLIKQKNHEIENEVRFIILLEEDDHQKFFRSSNGLIIPCIKMKAEKSLPIRSVTLGPKIHDDIAIFGVSQLLNMKHPKAVIDRSKIKLR